MISEEDGGETTDQESIKSIPQDGEMCPIAISDRALIGQPLLSCASVGLKQATESLMECFDLAEYWIADTGCGQDVVPKKIVSAYNIRYSEDQIQYLENHDFCDVCRPTGHGQKP